MAIDSSGVVYVTNYVNSHMQLFAADGQFISSIGCRGFGHGQLRYPTGVCIDSTNIVYARCTDKNNCVPVTH